MLNCFMKLRKKLSSCLTIILQLYLRLNLKFKILIPKQMLQKLPIALTPVKASNTPEN